MAAADLLNKAKKTLSREDILSAMSGHICRCGTYNQIAQAIALAQKTLKGGQA